MRMKKSNAFIWIMAILALIAVYMLGRYFWQFAENGWSNDPMEWGAFGSYMGAITGLLAFVGVLYSVHNANKKSTEAKDEAEKVRKEAAAEDKKIREEAKIESEKLQHEARAKNEKDTLFRLFELHQRSMETLVYKNPGIQRKSSMMEAFEDYKKELDSDLQEVIVFWSSSKFNSYSDWAEKILYKCYEGFELVLLAGMYIVDQREKGNEIGSKGSKRMGSLIENPTLKEEVKSLSGVYFSKMKSLLEDFVWEKKIYPYYNDFLEVDRAHFKKFANKMWLEEMDEKERFSILKFLAECFYRKYGHLLSFHFNNLCNITYQIDALETDHDFFMDCWISNIISIESVILFFWMLSGKVNKEVLLIAQKNNLFKNMNLGEFCAYKWDDDNDKAIRVTNDYLQMQIDGVESIPFFKSCGPFDESIVSE